MTLNKTQIAALIAGGIVVFGIAGVAAFGAEVPYILKAPEAQSDYDLKRSDAEKSLITFCKSWKELAKAKALDAMNVGKTDKVDLNGLNEIANKFDCSTVKAPYSF